ncbi:N-acetyltransferase [Mycolicibacterium sp. 120266]|uniref:GNAT family N-acetyltransferase n=1 Tax=Mycolicibacterium sp. 120266 TaxID=3090601 RepID=UPI00299D857E|nr:N-acetyltransferase [Mycolicibacterium sp. 120266]MDX1873480.1 N-acetyltransferase [Mycolicibacterium sp. 120266]
MATYLVDLSPAAMQRRLNEALTVYVDAMRYPRGTEGQRAAMWLEHSRRPGWKGVAVIDTGDTGPTVGTDTDADGIVGSADTDGIVGSADGDLVGIAYGYCGAPDQWWQQQVVQGLRRVGTDQAHVAALMSSYFELTELHIHPRAQGRGLGEALLRRLLSGRAETHVLLSTPEINGEANRAWRLYRRLGFTDVIRDYHFAGDPRAFAILGRSLPLDGPDLAR